MLQKQFKVNTAVARKKAKARKYEPRNDESVMDYFYSKINLLRTSKAEIEHTELIDEIWLGLPPSFQVYFDYESVKNKEPEEFRQLLQSKDLSFQEIWKAGRRRENNADRRDYKKFKPSTRERSSRYDRSDRKRKRSRD
jgi:hypothetical protein